MLLSISCSRDGRVKDLKFDEVTMKSLEYRARKNMKLNAELSELVGGNSELRTLVVNTIDTLIILKEELIEKNGGYEGAPGLFLMNPEIVHLSEFVERNKTGVNKDYINRVSRYLLAKGMKCRLTAMDTADDPSYQLDPNQKQYSFFYLFFDHRNIYQILAKIEEIKLDILELEREFLQSQMIDES